MMARIRKSMNEKEKGFTLIELLVVIIIIGILSAIAIPLFLNQRQKAVDASMKSDLRSVATSMETYLTDHAGYPTTTGLITPKLSAGNTIRVVATVDSYQLYATRTSGSTTATQTNWTYDSTLGGLQTPATATLPTTGYVIP